MRHVLGFPYLFIRISSDIRCKFSEFVEVPQIKCVLVRILNELLKSGEVDIPYSNGKYLHRTI